MFREPHRAALGLLLVVMGTVAACQTDPHASAYTIRKPDLGELIGSWTPTHSSYQQLARGPYAGLSPRIELRADGTIELIDIPDSTWAGAAVARGPGPSSGFSGRWHLGRHQGRWGIVLEGHDWVCDGCLMLLGQPSPLALLMDFDDPDAGHGCEFEKVK
jgi:hypothetical protein